MSKLIGDKPNQVPTNADLGTLAYQDSDNVVVGDITATSFSGDGSSLTGVQPYDANLESFVDTFTLPTTDGSADQILTTNGNGTLSFADAGGGAWTHLNTIVETSGASYLTFDSTYINTDYDFYMFILSLRSTSSSGPFILEYQMTHGGSFSETSKHYYGLMQYDTSSSSSIAGQNGNAETTARLTGTTFQGMSNAILYLDNNDANNLDSMTGKFPRAFGQYFNNSFDSINSTHRMGFFGCNYNEANAKINGIRFRANSQNLKGQISCYGLTRS